MTTKITVSIKQLLNAMKGKDSIDDDYYQNEDINEYIATFQKNTGMTMEILPLSTYVSEHETEREIVQKWVTENKLEYQVVKPPTNTIDIKDVIARYENGTLTDAGIQQFKLCKVNISRLNMVNVRRDHKVINNKVVTTKVEKTPIRHKIPHGLWFTLASNDYYISISESIDKSLHDDYYREYTRSHGIEDLKSTMKAPDYPDLLKWLSTKTIVEDVDFSQSCPDIKVAHQIKSSDLQKAIEYVKANNIKKESIVLTSCTDEHEKMYHKLIQYVCKEEGKTEISKSIAAVINS